VNKHGVGRKYQISHLHGIYLVRLMITAQLSFIRYIDLNWVTPNTSVEFHQPLQCKGLEIHAEGMVTKSDGWGPTK
jgi:hypothetical protein